MQRKRRTGRGEGGGGHALREGVAVEFSEFERCEPWSRGTGEGNDEKTHVCDTQENERDKCLAKRLVTSRGAHTSLSLSALTLCPDLEFRLLGSGENRDGRRRARRSSLLA